MLFLTTREITCFFERPWKPMSSSTILVSFTIFKGQEIEKPQEMHVTWPSWLQLFPNPGQTIIFDSDRFWVCLRKLNSNFFHLDNCLSLFYHSVLIFNHFFVEIPMNVFFWIEWGTARVTFCWQAPDETAFQVSWRSNFWFWVTLKKQWCLLVEWT